MNKRVVAGDYLIMTGSRSRRGAMIGVVSLAIAGLVAVAMAGFTFHSLFFQFGRSQNEADAMAVKLASKINFGDRVGQINELEECSRELIHFSQQDAKHCQEGGFDFLVPLCGQLADEARAGHELIERERLHQIDLIAKDMWNDAYRYNSRQGQGLTISLPWLQTREPKIMRVDVGYITKVDSNVKNLDVIKELSDYDRSSGYLNDTGNFYRANLSTTVPDGGNLSFNFSPLPAYVDKTCAPARCTNPEVFVKTGTVFSNGEAPLDAINQLPSAVRVFYSVSASSGTQGKYEGQVSIVSTAATTGAIAGAD